MKPDLFTPKLFLRFKDSSDNPFVIIHRDKDAITIETFWQISDWQARYIELATMEGQKHLPKMYLNAAYLINDPNADISQIQGITIPLRYNESESSSFTIACQLKKDYGNLIVDLFSNYKDACLRFDTEYQEGNNPLMYTDAESFATEDGSPLVPPIDPK
jgi:hypothetical protein